MKRTRADASTVHYEIGLDVVLLPLAIAKLLPKAALRIARYSELFVTIASAIVAILRFDFPGLALLLVSIVGRRERLIPVVIAYIITSAVMVGVYRAAMARRFKRRGPKPEFEEGRCHDQVEPTHARTSSQGP